jgi:integrase
MKPAVNISQRFVKSLKPPVSGYEIFCDKQIRGFGVRITAAGAISFVLAYTTIHGRERRYTIYSWPEFTADAAREEALNLRQRIQKGIDPIEEKEAKRTEPLLSDLADDYMSKYAETKKRPSSLRNDRQMLDKIIRPALGKLRLRAVTRRDIELLHGSLKSTPYRANRVLALLSSMFNFAIEWEWTESNPVEGVKRYEEPQRATWLSLEQLQSLETALREYPDQVAAAAIRLLIVTGSRENEVLSANWSQFDLKRGVWTKPSHHTKTKKTEHVPLNQAAMRILFELHKNSSSGFLFPGADSNRKTHRVTIRKPWMQILRGSGLAVGEQVPSKRKGMMKTIWKPLVRVHDLRHSFASHLVSSGASLYLVGKLLGHTQASTTQRYAHCSDEALRGVTNSFPMLSAKVN